VLAERAEELFDLPEAAEHLLERQQLHGLRIGSGQALSQRELQPSAAPLLRSPAARVIDEDVTDHPGCNSEEMRPIPPRGRRLVHELKVGFVNHGSGTERVVRALGLEPPVGDPSQIIVHERNEPIERVSFAACALREELSHLASLYHS
jgi:hypothetical protein